MNAGVILSLITLLAIVHSPAVDLEAQARMSPEALARYSAPGEMSRWQGLMERYAQGEPLNGAPAAGIRMPVSQFADGRTKTLLTAKRALISPDTMLIKAFDIHVEVYREDGSVEMTLDASSFLFDRSLMLGYTAERVTFVQGSESLTGVGACFDAQASYLKILSAAELKSARIDVDFTSRGMF